MAGAARFHALDRTDRSILRLLQGNARASYAELGKEVGLSPTSVAERVRTLEQNGIIAGYRARVDAAQLGFPVTAYILARPNGPDARFVKIAAERPEILACDRVTGEFSFIARAALRDVKHLEELLNHLEPATVHVVTLVVLSTPIDGVPVDVG